MYSKATIKVGITGHHRLEDSANVRALIKAELAQILKQHEGACLLGYSSLATGADTIFAEEIIMA